MDRMGQLTDRLLGRERLPFETNLSSSNTVSHARFSDRRGPHIVQSVTTALRGSTITAHGELHLLLSIWFQRKPGRMILLHIHANSFSGLVIVSENEIIGIFISSWWALGFTASSFFHVPSAISYYLPKRMVTGKHPQSAFKTLPELKSHPPA